VREMFSRAELEELIRTLEIKAAQHKAQSQELSDSHDKAGSAQDADAEWQEEGISRGLKQAADLIEETMRQPIKPSPSRS